MARSKRRREQEEEEEEELELPPSDADELEEFGADQQQQQQEEEDAAAAAAAAGPSSRRLQSEYPRGTVKRVKVYNFMTYGTPAVEITPGPRLNLVLGPNGTGKSSLVCALCLGLTGAPKLLGRADNIKDFIKRGADSGWVETTLSGGPGRRDSVIRCEMLKTAEGYTTRWKINGATKPMRDVKELVKGMNIQFDNLCQFLPQDKVVEFARLNPYELLVATEKAIGDASLHDTHMELIAKRDAMKGREQKREAEQQAHDALVAQNQGLEREYQRFEKKQKLLKSIQVIKKKLAWMDVKDAQEAAKAAGQEEMEKEKQLKEARSAAKGDERPAKQREQQAAAARQHTAAVMQDVKKQETRVKKAMEKAGEEESTVRALREQVNGLAAESQKRQQGIDALKMKIVLAKKKLDELGPIPDHTAEINQITQQQNELRDQVQSLESDKLSSMGDLQHASLMKVQKEAALREVASASWRLLAAIVSIQSRFMRCNLEPLHKFTQWVAQQRAANMFRGQVAGPLGVEIKLKSRINGRALDRNWVANLEQAVWSQMPNFACQNRDDERYLTNALQQHGLNTVKVVVVTGNIDEHIGSETANLGNYGVVASLNELFDAPPLARHALNNVCGLDSSYVMTQHDLDTAKAMMETHPKVRRVYSPEQSMTYVRSAYGTKEDAHVKCENLMPCKILGASGAVSDVDERKQLLQTELRAINARIAELEEVQRSADASITPLQQQVDALQKRKLELQADTHSKAQGKRKLHTTLKQAEALLAKQEASPDPQQQAPELEGKIKAALKRHHAAVTEALAGTQEGWKLLQQHVVAELTMRELDMQAKAMLAHIAEQRRAVTALEAEHKAAVVRARALMDAYRRAKEGAEEEHPLDAAAKKAFTELSDDRQELAADLAELEEKVDNISVSNPRVAQEYRVRKDQIEAKARELAALQSQLDADTQELDQLKARWLPELQRVVGVINSSFSTNFSEIGCAGEVLLEQHEDYDKFSIQIKVKFREEEQLQLLTGHRQSGGERSVSTILYLIALQGVTVTPFRVVDEINQGMDPANERKVFEQLVVASCKEGTPQCFLLTPKLLPDLPFTQDITVLNIFNGALISDTVATNYTMAKLFGSRKVDLLRQLRTVPVAG